jgi:hypothetical protein
MQNPWLSLVEDKNKCVAKLDASSVNDDCLRLDVLPEPFVGCLEAPVVLLNLNPGFDEENVEEHRCPEFRDLILNNLRQVPSEFPFYYLNPKIQPCKGAQYWTGKRGKLKRLMVDCGLKPVAQRVLCIEFFPYHSVTFPRRLRGAKLLPSQEFAVSLAKSAIGRNALIVIMRNKEIWERELRDLLKNHERKCVLNNPQNPTITPRNCPRYSEVVSIVCDGNLIVPNFFLQLGQPRTVTP